MVVTTHNPMTFKTCKLFELTWVFLSILKKVDEECQTWITDGEGHNHPPNHPTHNRWPLFTGPPFPFDGSQKIRSIIKNEKEGVNPEIDENKIEEGLPISKVFECKTLKDYSKTYGPRTACNPVTFSLCPLESWFVANWENKAHFGW